jgi:rod shape determining protein RodA
MKPLKSISKNSFNSLKGTKDSIHFDLINPLCIFILSIAGILFIFSAQSTLGGDDWKKQLVWVCLGALAYGVTSLINYKYILKYAHFIYFFGLLGLLMATPLSPFSVEMMGARRWINLGLTTVQPTEAAKIGTLIMAASLLARSNLENVKESLVVLLKIIFIFLVPMLLIFIQPDLGSALVFPPMIFSLLYVSNLSKKFFLSAFVIFAVIFSILCLDIYHYSRHLNTVQNSNNEQIQNSNFNSVIPLHNYQRNRILTFIAPKVVDPSGTGASWNANQAKISTATGGLLGKGFLKGTQAQLGYLPKAVAHNDFIFSVLAEETGFLGSTLIIGLFSLLVANGIRIAGLARDSFGSQLAIGISILFLVHFFINIGMAIGITPITGLPLPFLSYGGSFVLSCFILQGLIQSIYRYRKDFS